jgi:hypothetical protein
MGLTLKAATVLKGGRADVEGVFLPAQAFLGANDDSSHLVILQRKTFCCNHYKINSRRLTMESVIGPQKPIRFDHDIAVIVREYINCET